MYYTTGAEWTAGVKFSYDETLGYKNFDLVYESDKKDDFGRPCTVWGFGTKIGSYINADGDIGSNYNGIAAEDEIISALNDTAATFTGKITSKALYDVVGSTAAKNYTWTILVDGVDVDATEGAGTATAIRNSVYTNRSNTDFEFTNKKVGGAALTDNGVLTQVFIDTDHDKDSDKTVTISIINTYVAEVLKVNESDGTITLSDVGDGPVKSSDTFETTAFEEDDIVLYTYSKDTKEIQSVAAAKSIEGEISSLRLNTQNGDDTNSDRFVIDGTTYQYSYKHAGKTLVKENVDTTVQAYLDEYGYVIYIDEADVKYEYAYVLSVGSDKDKFGESSTGATAYARLILTDGTMVKVELDNSYDKAKAMENYLVAYTVDKNDVYTLSAKSASKYAKIASGTTIVENGKAKLDGLGTVTTADKNTIFVIVDTDTKMDDYEISVYTGIANVPDVDAASKTYAVAVGGTDNKSSIAKVVYIQDGDVGGSGNVYFAVANSEAKMFTDSENGDYYTIDAVVDGAVVTLNVKSNSSAADKLVKKISTEAVRGSNAAYITGKKTVVALKSITYNSDGFVTNVSLYDVYNKDNGDGVLYYIGTNKAENNAVGLGYVGGTYYAYDAPIVARYTVDDGKVVMSRISSVKNDSDDVVLAIMDDTVVVGLFIIEDKAASAVVDTPAEESTAVAFSIDGYEILGGYYDDGSNTEIKVENGVATIEFDSDARTKSVDDFVTLILRVKDADGNEFTIAINVYKAWADNKNTIALGTSGGDDADNGTTAPKASALIEAGTKTAADLAADNKIAGAHTVTVTVQGSNGAVNADKTQTWAFTEGDDIVVDLTDYAAAGTYSSVTVDTVESVSSVANEKLTISNKTADVAVVITLTEEVAETPATITIKYVTEAGGDAVDTQTETGVVGTKQTITLTVPAKYELVDNEEGTVTVTPDKAEYSYEVLVKEVEVETYTVTLGSGLATADTEFYAWTKDGSNDVYTIISDVKQTANKQPGGATYTYTATIPNGTKVLVTNVNATQANGFTEATDAVINGVVVTPIGTVGDTPIDISFTVNGKDISLDVTAGAEATTAATVTLGKGIEYAGETTETPVVVSVSDPDEDGVTTVTYTGSSATIQVKRTMGTKVYAVAADAAAVMTSSGEQALDANSEDTYTVSVSSSVAEIVATQVLTWDADVKVGQAAGSTTTANVAIGKVAVTAVKGTYVAYVETPKSGTVGDTFTSAVKSGEELEVGDKALTLVGAVKVSVSSDLTNKVFVYDVEEDVAKTTKVTDGAFLVATGSVYVNTADTAFTALGTNVGVNVTNDKTANVDTDGIIDPSDFEKIASGGAWTKDIELSVVTAVTFTDDYHDGMSATVYGPSSGAPVSVPSTAGDSLYFVNGATVVLTAGTEGTYESIAVTITGKAPAETWTTTGDEDCLQFVVGTEGLTVTATTGS
jgi:hypothetical protein